MRLELLVVVERMREEAVERGVGEIDPGREDVAIREPDRRPIEGIVVVVRLDPDPDLLGGAIVIIEPTSSRSPPCM